MKRDRLLRNTVIPAAAFLLLCVAVVVLARGADTLPPDDDFQEVHHSFDGEYAFPLRIDPELLEWTEYHWDDGNAVDIFADSSISHRSNLLEEIHSSQVLAIADGTAIRADNPRGGIAVVLQADNGMQFYYSHLSESTIEERESVEQGQSLGRIGNSGSRTQFIEPHLHFEVVDEWHEALSWPDSINAAHWIRRHFGLRWTDRDIPEYPRASPRGSPLVEEARIATNFSSMRREEPQTAGVLLRTESGRPGNARSVLPGEVTVMRGTPLGLRVQITNRPASTTVVYSGLEDTSLQTGSVVSHGRRIGQFTDTLHFMYFRDDEVTDPLEIDGWNPAHVHAD
ncbi:MAG: peptidoglycan DD-metalloendopeptidase family protein [Spirochaetia bacterium]